jgi:dihydroxyacetone kinase-like predicted kinase
LKGHPLRVHTHATTTVNKTNHDVVVEDVDPNKNEGYCTEAIVVLRNPEELKQDKIIEYLETIGDSIAVVLMDNILKFHVHTKEP